MSEMVKIVTLTKLPHQLEDLCPKYSSVPEAGIHPSIHVIINMMDLLKTPLNPSLGETLQIESPHMLPPMFLPSHHQIPQTHLPEMVMTILVCLELMPDSGQGRIGI